MAPKAQKNRASSAFHTPDQDAFNTNAASALLPQALSAVVHLLTLTRHTLSTGIGLPITGIGVAGRAAVHSAQQGA